MTATAVTAVLVVAVPVAVNPVAVEWVEVVEVRVEAVERAAAVEVWEGAAEVMEAVRAVKAAGREDQSTEGKA